MEYACWGREIDPAAHQQMTEACSLPIAAAGALMPDAHVGYGLPIGGVLATDKAVIPYAVGVDIACRVKLSVLDLPWGYFEQSRQLFRQVLEKGTRFGVGAEWRPRREHPVMDADWGFSPVVKNLKTLAWSQLGTSGSGNHFVEFGELELPEDHLGLTAGRYLALVSHSGSRGPGNQIATYYSKVAQVKRRDLPARLRHLAWLSLAGEGAEYWAAMELMGQYASANHQLIHEGLLKDLGAQCLAQVENHHNYAWQEWHQGREVVVHRKGATPAGAGVLGYIPGTMVDPGFLVEGLGEPRSLNSCSHGAGRRMSRKQAKKNTSRRELEQVLADRGVELLSAGLDEAPQAYKDIETVMASQQQLVRILGRFQPRLVKMAAAGQRAED